MEASPPPAEGWPTQLPSRDVDGVTAMGHWSFSIPDYSMCPLDDDNSMRGEIRMLGGRGWRIFVFPCVRAKGVAAGSTSVFLELLDPRNPQAAAFVIRITSSEKAYTYDRFATHYFNADSTDWGFRSMLPRSTVCNRERGFLSENDTVNVEMHVAVFDSEASMLEWKKGKAKAEPSGDAWNTSRSSTLAHVGLKNQGATCYLNSLLQSLFHTAKFRKAVYHTPSEENWTQSQLEEAAETGDDSSDSGSSGTGAVYVHSRVNTAADKTPSNSSNKEQTVDSVPLALQRVFYQLQTFNQAVGTTKLTKSFGWNSYDAFQQHDVQELDRVLCDNLEQKMKGTAQEDVVKQLFCGKMRNFIRCVNVDYKSERVEDFYDLSMNVKGCQHLLESFKQYVEKERMDGENKYNAEQHGYQDADRGTEFVEFPEVLHLHLKRFEYDWQRDCMIKINDFFEFPDRLDLTEFLTDANPDNAPVYRLHSVMVHSGNVHGGHYYSFVRPNRDSAWYRFDDERVSQVPVWNALDDNFGLGSVDGSKPSKAATLSKGNTFSNAYMLAYVKETAAEKVLFDVTVADIPKTLRMRFEAEQQMADGRRKEREALKMLCKVDYLISEDVGCYAGPGLVPNEATYRHKEINKAATVSELAALFAKELDCEASDIYIAKLPHATDLQFGTESRSSELVYPQFFSEGSAETTVDQVIYRSAYASYKLFVCTNQEVVDIRHLCTSPTLKHPLPSIHKSADPSCRLVHLKAFCPPRKQVEYIRPMLVTSSANYDDFFAAAKHVLATDEIGSNFYSTSDNENNNQLRILKEQNGGMSIVLEKQQPSELVIAKLMSVFVLDINDASLMPDVQPGEQPQNAEQYYNKVLNTLHISFRPIHTPDEESLHLSVGAEETIPMVKEQLAHGLNSGIPATRIKLWPHDMFYNKPHTAHITVNVTSTGAERSLSSVLQRYGNNSSQRKFILYYEFKDAGEDMDSDVSKSKIEYWPLRGPKQTLVLPVPARQSWSASIQALQDSMETAGPRYCRVVEIMPSQNRIMFVFSATDLIPTPNPNSKYRFEEIPEHHQTIPEDSLLMTVTVFSRNSSKFGNHGVQNDMESNPPFIVRIDNDTDGQSLNANIEQEASRIWATAGLSIEKRGDQVSDAAARKNTETGTGGKPEQGQAKVVRGHLPDGKQYRLVLLCDGASIPILPSSNIMQMIKDQAPKFLERSPSSYRALHIGIELPSVKEASGDASIRITR